MYTIVYENGKRFTFSSRYLLLSYFLYFCPKMQLRTYALIFEWLDDEDDSSPFCWESFYIIKECF